ncbi:MAG: YdeI/OmpD-associated family protein [Planctomycetota bacterium]
MDAYYPHVFEGEVAEYDVGSSRYVYTVVWLPEAMQADLPLTEYPRLRVSGEMNETEFTSALMPVPGQTVPGTQGKRRWYLPLSKKQLRAMEARLGSVLRVRFRVADQDAVEVPTVLAAALKNNAKMRKLWEGLTPGKQRGLAYRVASAKRAETQTKRVTEVFEILTGVRDERGKRRPG